MSDTTYKKSLKEVYIILNSSNQNIIDKLPNDLKQYIINNMDDSYEFAIDLNKSLSEQTLMDKTKIILAKIYKNYLCHDNEIIKLNELRKFKDEEKKSKYNPDDLFNKKSYNKEEHSASNNLPIEIKKLTLFQKIFNFIKIFLYR